MVKTLESLDIQVKGDVCVSPSFRIDLERPADIAEEVARIYGYNNIPSTVIRGVAEAQLTPQQQPAEGRTDHGRSGILRHTDLFVHFAEVL